ncbi:MAG: bifunctional folylpolyglutamate synthase/dihydrofolate synthase [Rhodospirillales bacterium]|nr:bifunctional folylpolyglutamate synthase/dihydrofolate synthase [Rhodospirillales bacterium]
MSSDQTTQILDRLTALYPRAIDLSLERLLLLLDDLGNPQDRLPPVVHIAGTNGKGSTIAYLRAAAEAAGYRAHVYTSPHLVRFNERIRLAGALIENDFLTELLGEVERVNAGRPITFFEVTTAAAFLAFARIPADLVLLETGLGGRLDATNVIARPAVCGITPISFDHPDFLGDSVAQIAGEKAGILKRGVTAVIGPQPDDAAPVIAARAASVGAPLVLHGRDWRVEERDGGFRYIGRATLDLPTPALPGRHQIDNAGLAAAIVEHLPGFAITPRHLADGLRNVEWPARLQRLTAGPLVDLLPPGGELYLDGGHNESGGAAIADWAGKIADGRKLSLVIAMKASKAADTFLAHLAPHAERLRSLSFPEETGWIDAARIAELARAAGIADAAASRDPAAAVAELVAGAGAAPRILICGSLYFAGRILSENA